MKFRVLIISIFLTIGINFSTNADTIIYNKITYELYEYPLQIIPEFKQWNISSIFGKDAEIATAFDELPYHCTWIVKNNHIYLQSIKSGKLTANLQTIFPEKIDDGLVLADWIDMTLYAPYGKGLCSWGVTFSESTYEYELAFEIHNGKIVSVTKCDNTNTRTLDDKTLKERIQQTINWESLPESDSIDKRVVVQVISTDSSGNIDSVEVIRGNNSFYEKEAVRVVKAIPEWPVIFRHGKVFDNFVIPIYFKKADKTNILQEYNNK